MKVRPGPELAGRAYMKRFGIGLGPGEQFLGGGRRRLAPCRACIRAAARTGRRRRTRPGSAARPCIFARAGQVDVVELGQLGRVVGQRSAIQSFWSTPAESASMPVSTRSMSTRLASCCALILPGSSGAGALVKVMRETSFGLGGGVGLDRLLRQREIAGDVDDVQRDGRGRQRQTRPGQEGECCHRRRARRQCRRAACGVYSLVMLFLPWIRALLF